MSTTAPEYLTSLRDGFADAVQQWVDQSTTAWDQWSRAWAPVAEAAGLGMPGAPSAARGPGAQGGHHHEPGHHHEQGHHHEHCDHEHGPGHQPGRRHDEKGCGYGGPDGVHDHGARHDHSGSHDCGCGGCDGRHDHGGRHDHAASHDCGCACGDVCDCCVPAADVIVRARAGEVRVVPFRLHNPWRREREVTLEVGPWHGCEGDGLQIRAVLEEQKVVLAPCEDRVVRLLVSARGGDDEGSSGTTDGESTGPGGTDDASGDPAVKQSRGAGTTDRESVDAVLAPRGRTKDVASCVSAYADVRFEGCARPQRVAVVVLPADCDPVDIGCDCGCCC